MKRSDEQEFRKHFDFYRSAKPDISKTLVRRCTLRDLCCGSRLRCNLGDVQARCIRIFLIVNVNCRVFTVLYIYFAGRSFGGHRGQAEITYPTLIGGAILLSISLILAIPLSINFTRKLDFDPGSVISFSQTSFSHKLIALPQPQDGPVAITYEFEVDRVREDEFMELMRQVRLIHLRNGAFSWQLHEDLTQFNVFRVEMIVPSWTQYVLQRDRMTKAEKNIIERARNLHIGQGPIREGIFLCVNKELVSHRRLAERQWRLQKRSP